MTQFLEHFLEVKLWRWRTDQWLPGSETGERRREGSGCDHEEVSEMELRGNGTVLYLDCGDGYMNQHM